MYIYTHGTHLVSSRKSRGDPAENPAEYPEGTWRLPGLQGPSVRHWLLIRQPCTASDNTGKAIDVIKCKGASCYAEVGFNTIMYYVLWHQPSEKTNALSLRDRREPSQYYQYQAIPRYISFYNVYVKSAKGTLCS